MSSRKTDTQKQAAQNESKVTSPQKDKEYKVVTGSTKSGNLRKWQIGKIGRQGKKDTGGLER